MNCLNSPENWMTIKRVPSVRTGFGGKIRLIAGIGINAIGAGVLLADSFGLLSSPL